MEVIMEDTVKFKRTIGPKGNTLGVNIPQELQQFLELKEGDEVVLIGDKSKHGKYIAVFKEKKR